MSQQFDEAILGIGQAYRPYRYWLENLFPGSSPDATWRALMVISALKDNAFIDQVSGLLKSLDSRVRAWACYYLGSIQHQSASDRLFALTNDPSPRVRFHARHAFAMLQPETKLDWDRGRRAVHGEFRVLISEDDRRGRERMALMLKQAGFNVAWAYTEKETISLAIQMQPQVIITDNQKIAKDAKGGLIVRDDLSGLNMTWDLCRIPELRETILVMLTADEVEPIFLWQGGDYFLNKQRFGGAQLVHALEAYMI